MNPTIVESTHKIDTQRGSLFAIQEPTANKLIRNVNIDAPIGYKLTPLFAYASDVFEVLPDYHNFDELSEPLRADGDRTSQKFGIDFGQLISGLNTHQNKFVENALRSMVP